MSGRNMSIADEMVQMELEKQQARDRELAQLRTEVTKLRERELRWSGPVNGVMTVTSGPTELEQLRARVAELERQCKEEREAREMVIEDRAGCLAGEERLRVELAKAERERDEARASMKELREEKRWAERLADEWFDRYRRVHVLFGDKEDEHRVPWHIDKLRARLAAVAEVVKELRDRSRDGSYRYCSSLMAYELAADLLEAAMKGGGR